MLSDASKFAVHHMGVPDSIKQCCLSMVDVPHDGHHRGTRLQQLGRGWRSKISKCIYASSNSFVSKLCRLKCVFIFLVQRIKIMGEQYKYTHRFTSFLPDNVIELQSTFYLILSF